MYISNLSNKAPAYWINIVSWSPIEHGNFQTLPLAHLRSFSRINLMLPSDTKANQEYPFKMITWVLQPLKVSHKIRFRLQNIDQRINRVFIGPGELQEHWYESSIFIYHAWYESYPKINIFFLAVCLGVTEFTIKIQNFRKVTNLK